MLKTLLLLGFLLAHADALGDGPTVTWNCTNVLDWNFFGANVTQNNLGGFGPNLADHEEIRYSGVLSDHGQRADLVVTADGPYRVHNPTQNGLLGKFGQINIVDDTEVTLKFSLVLAGTDIPFNITATEKLVVSVYDLDSNNGVDHEYVQFLTGVASHSVTANTTVEVSGNDGDGSLYAQSGRAGDFADNPTDPLAMTQLQIDSKISVTYVGKSSWELVWGHKGAKPTKKEHGRNILFAGRSEGDCACIGISEWTIHDNLQHNNLGGKGPVTTDPPELRYSNVLKAGWDQRSIDLVIKVAEGHQYEPANTTLNGLWPGGIVSHQQMGQINVHCGTETTFDFMFVDSGTDTPYTLPNVLFSVYDLDQSKKADNHEYLSFPQIVSNWTLTQDPPTTVKMTGQNDGTLRFTSTIPGVLSDNPTDPTNLTPLQRSKSVTVWYEASAKFQVTFGHEGPGDGGRNALFAGPGIYCPAPSPPPSQLKY